MSPPTAENSLQWSDDEGEASDMPLQQQLALCKQAESVNMVDNNNDDLRQRMEAQEQTSKASKKPWTTSNKC